MAQMMGCVHNSRKTRSGWFAHVAGAQEGMNQQWLVARHAGLPKLGCVVLAIIMQGIKFGCHHEGWGEGMLWGEAITHPHNGNACPITNFSADVVMAINASQHIAAAVNIEHHRIGFPGLRLVKAAGNIAHPEV